MRELGEGHGALVVDPHAPADIAHAMGRLLVDDALREELVGLTASMPRPTWDDYAARLWTLVDGQPAESAVPEPDGVPTHDEVTGA